MPVLLWDASALAKRYAPETGSSTANALFGYSPRLPMAVTFWGYTETYAILVRKHNTGRLNAREFSLSLSALYNEVILADFDLLSISDVMVMNSVTLVLNHNLNSADAAILATFLDYASSLPMTQGPCVLVASDQRLLRAATAEGLLTLNPETLQAADVPEFLAAL